MSDTTITRPDAQHVLYVWDKDAKGGMEPGSFTTLLIEAIIKADLTNKAKLANEYPGLVRAVSMIQNDRDGLQSLQNIAAFAPEPASEPAPVRTWNNGGITFAVCPVCKGENSADWVDGRMISWCGRCSGDGRITVK